jgi:drug/metabolite transporter (DMT)-like permease
MNAYVLLAITILGYSLSVIFEKKTLQIIDADEAIVFKGILYLIFGVITLILLKIFNKPIIENKYKNYKKGLIYFFFSYLIIFAIGNLGYYYVLKRTNEITKISFILIIFNTINILALTYFLRGERVNLLSIIGLVIALIGVAITIKN